MRRFRVGVAVSAVTALACVLASTGPAAAESYPPSPTPTATVTPSPSPTPTPAPTPTATPTPTETFLPSPPPPGGATVLIGGVEVPVVVDTNEDRGVTTVNGGLFEIVVDPKAPGGGNLGASSDGVLVVNTGGDVQSSGRGFLSGSVVNFYLLRGTTATFLGALDVFTDGTYSGAVPIPANLAPGVYTLQVVGLTNATRQRADAVTRVISISLLVQVTKPKVSQPRTFRTAVYFDVFSAALTDSAKAQLSSVAKRLPSKKGNRVRIVGFVGPGGTIGHINTLARARAASVARYLRTQGVRGTYVLKVGGNARVNNPSSRRANVLIVSPAR